jgi:hypothetical protein
MRLNFRLSFEEKLKKWRTNLARAARHSSLETRTARARLPARRTPYFAKIAKGLRLGYYRGAVSGSWVASLYRGTKGYETQAIGAADDTTDADAVAVFDFWQAQDQARKWAERQRLIAAGVIRSGPYKVADAVRDYLAEIAAEKKPMAVHGAQGNRQPHSLDAEDRAQPRFLRRPGVVRQRLSEGQAVQKGRRGRGSQSQHSRDSTLSECMPCGLSEVD